MDLFARLHAATVLAGQDNDLPEFFAERLFAAASFPHCYPDAAEEILTIIDMLPEYDTYAQTGYMGMGVNNAILEGALRRLEAKRGSVGTGSVAAT